MRVADLVEIPQSFEKYLFYMIPRLIVGLFCSLLYVLRVKNMHSWPSTDPFEVHEARRNQATYLDYIIRQAKSRTTYIKTHFSVSLPPQCCPKQLSTLAYLG